MEAGGHVSDQNEERLLSSTHVPVHPDDMRRLELVIPSLNVYSGLPFFCDATIVGPIAATATHAQAPAMSEADFCKQRSEKMMTTMRSSFLLSLGCKVYWALACTECGHRSETGSGNKPRISPENTPWSATSISTALVGYPRDCVATCGRTLRIAQWSGLRLGYGTA